MGVGRRDGGGERSEAGEEDGEEEGEEEEDDEGEKGDGGE